MVQDTLDPPVFEVEKFSQPVSLARTPFLYNDGGRPAYPAGGPLGAARLGAVHPAEAGGAGQACIDLHNNRNSARACWGDIERGSVTTHTLLQASGGVFHWYWNAGDSGHARPAGAPRP